jgi:curved DNA-binding protein CbpA
MADQLRTAYEVLGVVPEASATEITSAYRRLLRRHHPDSRDASQGLERDDHASGEDAAGALGSIIAAYAVLRDPARRAAYDRRLEALKPPTITYRPAASRDFLLRAGPVRWQQEPTSSRRLRQPTVAESEAMELVLQILRGRWLY